MQTAPQIVTLKLNDAGRDAWEKAFIDECLSMRRQAIEAEEARILDEWGPLAPLMMPAKVAGIDYQPRKFKNLGEINHGRK